MSLLLNILSRFVRAFLPRSKCLNFVAVVTVRVDFGTQENKVCHCFHFPPSICHEVRGPDTTLVSWVSSFKPAFLLFSFTLTKKLFSCSSLSAIRMVLSVYLRLMIFLPAILIPAFNSSSSAFHMMYSEYKLNRQGDNVQPWSTSFPILNQSFVPCPFLTVVFWPAYRYLRRQVRWFGIPVSSRIFHSLFWSTQSEALM